MMKKPWREFSVEGKEEGIIIKFTFHKCHWLQCRDQIDRGLEKKRKHDFLSVNNIC